MSGIYHYWSNQKDDVLCGCLSGGVTAEIQLVTYERCKKLLGITEKKKVIIG